MGVQESCDTTDQLEYCYEPWTSNVDKKAKKEASTKRSVECRNRNLELAYLATTVGVELKDFTKENIMRTKATNVWKVSDFEFEISNQKRFNPLDKVAKENMELATEIMANCYKTIKLKLAQAKLKKTSMKNRGRK